MKLTLSTLADAVPPESLDEHRKTIREIRAQSAWSILAAGGRSASASEEEILGRSLFVESELFHAWDSPRRQLLRDLLNRTRRCMPPASKMPDAGTRAQCHAPAFGQIAGTKAKSRRKRKHRKKREKIAEPSGISLWLCALALLLDFDCFFGGQECRSLARFQIPAEAAAA